MHEASHLGPEQRQASLARLGKDVFDVVVIGGGAVGSGSALDAVTRGLNVALVEARDFGPRIFAWAAGWKDIAFPGNYGNVNTYFWIPILGPFIGGCIGAAVYDGLIRGVLRARKAN